MYILFVILNDEEWFKVVLSLYLTESSLEIEEINVQLVSEFSEISEFYYFTENEYI